MARDYHKSDSISSKIDFLELMNELRYRKFIDDQFEKYHLNEMACGSERKKIPDPRVDCCLYFIPPHVRG